MVPRVHSRSRIYPDSAACRTGEGRKRVALILTDDAGKVTCRRCLALRDAIEPSEAAIRSASALWNHDPHADFEDQLAMALYRAYAVDFPSAASVTHS